MNESYIDPEHVIMSFLSRFCPRLIASKRRLPFYLHYELIELFSLSDYSCFPYSIVSLNFISFMTQLQLSPGASNHFLFLDDFSTTCKTAKKS